MPEAVYAVEWRLVTLVHVAMLVLVVVAAPHVVRFTAMGLRNGPGAGRGCEVDRPRGMSPLWAATEKCDLDTVMQLLQSGQSTEQTYKGWTPVMKAAEEVTKHHTCDRDPVDSHWCNMLMQQVLPWLPRCRRSRLR